MSLSSCVLLSALLYEIHHSSGRSPRSDRPCWQEQLHHSLILKHNKVSCTIYHKSLKTILQGHSFSPLITFSFPPSFPSSFNHSDSVIPPLSLISSFFLPPLCIRLSVFFDWITDWFTALLTSLLCLPSPFLFHSLHAWCVDHSLIPFPPSFSICSTFTRFLHPSLSLCLPLPFVLLYCKTPSPAPSSTPPLIPVWCSPALTPSNDGLLLTFSSPTLLPCSSSSSLPSPASNLFSLSPIFFFYTLLSPPIYFSLSLSFFPFTLSDGSIDSLCDDIAQGQPRGSKPL